MGRHLQFRVFQAEGELFEPDVLGWYWTRAGGLPEGPFDTRDQAVLAARQEIGPGAEEVG